jgi:hypothetical protein
LGVKNTAVFQDRTSRSHDGWLPLIGIYSCLLCERRFSTKPQLNRHYRERHRENIQDYTGKGRVIIVWYPSRPVRKPRDFQDAYKYIDEQND